MNKEKQIIDLYLSQNKSMAFISRELQIPLYSVRKTLQNNNITIRNNNCYKTKSVDENFFEKIDTPEKAYILGLVYADGYLTNGVFGLCLIDKDRYMLEEIKKLMKSSHKIVDRSRIEPTGTIVNSSIFQLKNKKIEQDLLDKGVFYRKTKILKFPTEEQVPNSLLSHFVRGFFDGDGSVYYSNAGIIISLLGTYSMMESILSIFKDLSGTNSKIYQDKRHDELYYISVGGKNMVFSIYQYLYKDASLFLERKKKKFDDFYS